ncbi:hypothetical protein LDENG_00233650 [Lucifuga dentata]|nr:hypothetical protein LDENG_00233650 [Lucifuga dentata]
MQFIESGTSAPADLLRNGPEEVMTSVWKRLQRVGKKASKFQFVASYQELVLECTKKWQPDKVRVVWTRRNRRMCSKLHSWQPGIKNPYRGMVVWPVPENIDISVTLFKEPNADEFEDKEWTFVIEGESKGHRKVLASVDINLKRFASPTPTQTDLTLKLKPLSVKVVEATLKLSLSCVFLREGKATDEDMQSLASLMSVKPTDIGNLDDFNEGDEEEDKKSVTATAPHTLTRPNRPAPPPPDKRNSTGHTTATSDAGREGGPPSPALHSRPPLPIAPRPSPRHSRHAFSTTPIQSGTQAPPGPSPQPSPRSKHKKSEGPVLPEAPVLSGPQPNPPSPKTAEVSTISQSTSSALPHSDVSLSLTNPPSPKTLNSTPICTPSSQNTSSIMSTSVKASSSPHPPSLTKDVSMLPVSSVVKMPSVSQTSSPPTSSYHKIQSNTPSNLSSKPPCASKTSVISSAPQLSSPTLSSPESLAQSPAIASQNPPLYISTGPTLFQTVSPTSQPLPSKSSSSPHKSTPSSETPSTNPPLNRTLSQPPSLPRIFQPGSGKVPVSYQRCPPEAQTVDEPSSVCVVRSHIFRPQIVKSVARPSSPSPFTSDACTLSSAPPLPKPHPASSESGGQRVWLKSDSTLTGGDITPVPLLTTPDLDALCDPEAPHLSASLPLPSPPRSSSISTFAAFSSPLSVAHSQLPVSAPPAQLTSCQLGSTSPLRQVNKEITPVAKEAAPGKESPQRNQAGASIRLAMPPKRPFQDLKETTTESKAEPGNISPGQSRSELIVAPPPPWPFSCSGSSSPQQTSTNVVAAFITPKQPNIHKEVDLKKPANERESIVSPFKTEKPLVTKPEAKLNFDDIIFESFAENQESGGLFLEEGDSKQDTIKRCPAG